MASTRITNLFLAAILAALIALTGMNYVSMRSAEYADCRTRDELLTQLASLENAVRGDLPPSLDQLPSKPIDTCAYLK